MPVHHEWVAPAGTIVAIMLTAATARDLETWRLENGLRVVAVPQPGTGVVCVSVTYAVGFRHEQAGQTGFAHLFEHLMTQGSAHLDKLEHKALAERSGGWYSGQTRHDYTGYMSTVPAGALRQMLWCEADRMTGLRLTRENLDNQVSVVKQEIRGNILSQPYGGFPYFQVDAALFTRFANNHDGYGDFGDLDRVQVADAERFFADYYGPGNAVLAVAGDFRPSRVRADVERYFGAIAGRSTPAPPDLAERPLAATTVSTLADPRAADAALAVGYRTPDPAGQRPDYLRLRLLSSLLADGPRSRWARRLVAAEGKASAVLAELGSLSDWNATVAPAQYAIGVRHDPGTRVDEILALLDDELGKLHEELSDDEVQRAARALGGRYRRALSAAHSVAQYAALGELLFADASTVELPPRVWDETSADELRALARDWLIEPHRVVVALRPAARP